MSNERKKKKPNCLGFFFGVMKVPTQFYGDHFINHENPGLPIKQPIEYHQGVFSQNLVIQIGLVSVAVFRRWIYNSFASKKWKVWQWQLTVGMVFPGSHQLYK